MGFAGAVAVECYCLQLLRKDSVVVDVVADSDRPMRKGLAGLLRLRKPKVGQILKMVVAPLVQNHWAEMLRPQTDWRCFADQARWLNRRLVVWTARRLRIRMQAFDPSVRVLQKHYSGQARMVVQTLKLHRPSLKAAQTLSFDLDLMAVQTLRHLRLQGQTQSQSLVEKASQKQMLGRRCFEVQPLGQTLRVFRILSFAGLGPTADQRH